MPFRGAPVALKEEEYERFVRTVHETSVQQFDLSVPAEFDAWRRVFDMLVNHLLKPIHIARNWTQKKDGTYAMIIYVEYTLPAKELVGGRPSMLAAP